MKLIIIESPYAGNVEQNLAYARAAMRDSIMRDEAPLASHLLYTQEGILNDDIPEERRLGISLGYWWGSKAATVAFYIDHGMSRGMEAALQYYQTHRIPIEYRKLYKENKG